MDKPSSYIIASVLFLIQNKRDVTDVFALGISLAQLPNLLRYLQTQEYCVRVDGEYSVTEKGQALIRSMSPSFTISESRINPKFEERIPKLLPEDIYIPSLPPAQLM